MKELFLSGVGFGLTGGLLLGAIFSIYQYKRLLVLKAETKYKTSEKIMGKFYYIVPEDEYLEMEKFSLFWKYDNQIEQQ